MTPPTLSELAKRASAAADLANVYRVALQNHQNDGKAAWIAAERFKRSAEDCAKLCGQVQTEMEWLATQLYEMNRALQAKKAKK